MRLKTKATEFEASDDMMAESVAVPRGLMAQSITQVRSRSRRNITVIDHSTESFAYLTSANGSPRRFRGKTTANIVPWKRYCNRINYSACNEDSSCEIRSLVPGPGKRLLCITAGGGRVLDLIAQGPEEVWAVDINVWQNYLFELKMAGIRALDHDSFLSFVGARPSSH